MLRWRGGGEERRGKDGQRGKGTDSGRQRMNGKKKTLPEWKDHTQRDGQQRQNDPEKQRKRREKPAKIVTFQWNLATAQATQIRRLLAFERIDSA